MNARVFALVYKPKWRQLHVGGLYHCFMRFSGRTQESVCGDHVWKGLIGATCERPICAIRCPRCDIGEMRIGRVDESYPESKVRKRP